MKLILLLRHAKSAWSHPGLNDHDRPLNRRGERAAEAMADHIVRNAPRPDLILCSTAARTRQTLASLEHRLALPAPPVRLERGLYLASSDTLLGRLRGLEEGFGSVLLIGHNDGIGELAARLAASGRATDLAALRAKFPTGTLAILRMPANQWSELSPGSAELLSFVRPRDLLPE